MRLAAVFAAFFLAFAAAQIPVGIALDRIGPRRTMSGLMLLAVAGSMLFASASDGWTATFAQVLIGLGCAPILMSSFVVIARFLPPSRFAVASATIIAIGNAGNLLGTSPLGVAAEILGWRGALWIVAAITVASTLAVMTFVRDWPPGITVPGAALGGVPVAAPGAVPGAGRVASPAAMPSSSSSSRPGFVAMRASGVRSRSCAERVAASSPVRVEY